jgi:hypothetical protein
MIDWLDSEKWVIVTFLLLNLADEITTSIALRQTPGQGERNVIMRKLMQRGGPLSSIWKWGLCIFLIAFLAVVRSTDGLVLVTTIMGLVVLGNLRSVLVYIWRPAYMRAKRAIPTDGLIYSIEVGELAIISGVITYLIHRGGFT